VRQVTATPDRAARRAASVAAAAVLAAAIGFVLRFDPTDRVADPTGPCLWHSLTGINGPGCGGTRMVYYLLHGDLAQAARFYSTVLEPAVGAVLLVRHPQPDAVTPARHAPGPARSPFADDASVCPAPVADANATYYPGPV
jgi:hypothetical protein